MWNNYENFSISDNQTAINASFGLPFIAISCTAVTLSLTANGILISISIAFRNYLSPTEMLITNLSISDVIFLIST